MALRDEEKWNCLQAASDSEDDSDRAGSNIALYDWSMDFNRIVMADLDY